MKPFRTKSLAELQGSAETGGHTLARRLRTKDLIFLGIGAVIGAGIFSSLGDAAALAGPAVVISFALLGVVCALCGLCYAELTSLIPVAGSAYTYAFATLGELAAWIIGWDLILEYAVGNIYVAISWSNYFQSILSQFGLQLPSWLGYSYGDVIQQLGAAQQSVADAAANHDAAAQAAAGVKVATMQGILDHAPHLFGWPMVLNIPAVLIVAVVTWLLVRGVRESATANNIMVVIKLLVLTLFVVVGAMHVDAANWQPFVPNGWTGIHRGAAIVFFAYIGFDAVSTASEETIDPQRSMPRGILGALAICTAIYMVVGFIATGLVHYSKLQGADPLASALAGVPAAQFIVAAGAVISMTAVLLVFQLGQPRIFMAMARDGLLPKVFAKVHDKHQTPHFATMLTGLAVALGAMLLDDDMTINLTNIGTLFAFLIACLGVMILRIKQPDVPRGFRVPAVWIVAPLGAAACIYTMCGLPVEAWVAFGVWLVVGLVIYVWMGALRRRAAAS